MNFVPSSIDPVRRRSSTSGDRGSILPLVLVISVVLAIVVAALASYTQTTLQLGQVAEASSDRLSAATGALDSALEDLERGVGPCLEHGQDYTITDSVNGIESTIDCNFIAGPFKVGEVFAVAMTGAGDGRTGPLLRVTNGGNSAQAVKTFEGPVYMANVPSSGGSNPSMSFSATLTIKNADLSFTSNDCANATVSLPSQLTIAPVGYGTQCYDLPWDDPAMFGGARPPEPNVGNGVAFPLRSSVAPVADSDGCTVWSPGRYDTPPQLGNQSYNYFRSGDYYFRDFGTWSTSSAFVLFGYPGDTGPSIDGIKPHDTFANNPCRFAWNEANHTGAAIYMGGDSQIFVEQNSSLEISGRNHSGHNVGLQALETFGDDSDVEGDEPILYTASGGNKQLSIQGLVWAPRAAFEFDLIANDAVAALTGGAVISELSAGASANANNFLIRVATNPATKQLQLTATASNSGTTSVRVVLDVQRSAGATAYAVRSRRVIGLTAE